MSWISKWWKSKVRKMVLKTIPYFSKALDEYFDIWIDQKQASTAALRVDPIREFIDDFQEDVMTPQAISEILEKVIKKL
jgi:hypothetical protein